MAHNFGKVGEIIEISFHRSTNRTIRPDFSYYKSQRFKFIFFARGEMVSAVSNGGYNGQF